MRYGFTVSVAAAVVVVLAQAPAEGQQYWRETREACQPFEGRCFTVMPPNLPFGEEAGDFEIPRLNGWPDFTAVWAGPGYTHQIGPGNTNGPLIRGFDAAKMAPLTRLGEAELFRPMTGDFDYDVRTHDPIALCLPYGFNGQILVPGYPQQWIQSEDYLVIRHEFMNNFTRVIPLDGRPHPEGLELTWGGHSVGRFEGDDLVIDTVGLKSWWLDNPHANGSLWHSDAEHVIERLRWIGPRVVWYEVTIDDPLYFTEPWSEEFYMVLHPNFEVLEFVCNENDRCSGGTCEPADVQLDQ